MLDDTPITVTLPAYMLAALRGAARRAARADRRSADRRAVNTSGTLTDAQHTQAGPRPSVDLDAQRALVLQDAADRIDAALPPRLETAQ